MIKTRFSELIILKAELCLTFKLKLPIFDDISP